MPSRFRTRGSQSITSVPYSIVPYGGSPLPPVSGVAATGNHAGDYASIQDVYTPGFRKTREYSRWVNNPLTIQKLVVRPSSGSATTRNVPNGLGQGQERTWSGDGVSLILGALCSKPGSLDFGSYPDLVNMSNLQSLAAIGCLNRINPPAMQAIVSTAEFGKSVSMIIQRAQKLAKVYAALKKGDIPTLEQLLPGTRKTRYPKRIVIWNSDGQPVVNRLKKVIDPKTGKAVATPQLDKRYGHVKLTPRRVDRLTAAARLELEWSYGWKPLVYDIIDALKAINAQVLRTSLLSKDFYSVFERKSGSQTQTTSGTTPPSGGGTWGWSQELKHTVDVYAYCKYTVGHRDGVMNRLNDFGVFDIPKSIWDLVPLSFLVDYLIDVGGWLAACSPKVGVNVIESGLTTRVTKTVTRTITGYTPVPASGAGAWLTAPFPLGSSDGFDAEIKLRSVGLQVPWFPPTEINLNFNRLVNVLALLRVLR